MVKESRAGSAFQDNGIDVVVQELVARTQSLYLEDEIPWVLGYSGGKDSTAVVQLVWNAIASLPEEKRTKPIHIISTDTLVENPIVALWVDSSLKAMETAIRRQCVPFHPHRLAPEVQDRFWVNLVGRGYPAPRPKFRWCTSRLKISPSTKFIKEVVQQQGEAILVLGTRKAESSKRHAQMRRTENSSRDLLHKNADPALDRTWVYAPIADWSNDDVWEYLTTYDNPWGYDNSELLGMYRGATKDNECPLVVDSSTPSCGDSRFGCYVCTLVDQDKSMAAMIQNSKEKHWMKPLMNLRNNHLDTNDRQYRDFRRMRGGLTVHNGQLVHGPYKQSRREELLEAILKAQQEVRRLGPEQVKNIELLTIEDLEEIRRIWVMDKHEIEDSVPRIYERVLGVPYPIKNIDEAQIFKPEDMEVLKQACEEQGDRDGIHYGMLRELLHLEQRHRTMARRSGLFEALDKALEVSAFHNMEEAEQFAVERDKALRAARGEGVREDDVEYGSEAQAAQIDFDILG